MNFEIGKLYYSEYHYITVTNNPTTAWAIVSSHHKMNFDKESVEAWIAHHNKIAGSKSQELKLLLPKKIFMVLNVVFIENNPFLQILFDENIGWIKYKVPLTRVGRNGN